MTQVPRRPLTDGETVEMVFRPHGKRMLRPALALLVTSPAATYLAAVVPAGRPQTPLRIAIVVVAAVLVLRGSVWPFLRWVTTSYVVTDRRIRTRTGVLARTGLDLPLAWVNDVAYSQRGLRQRLLHCGTLVVEATSDRGRLVLHDVPDVQAVQRDLLRLVTTAEQRRRGAGEPWRRVAH